MARESKLDGDIQDLIRSRGGWCVKTHGSSFMPAGTPDILACYGGRFIGIEDKIEGNRARAIQVKNLRDIARAGGYHLVAYAVEDVAAVLDTIDNLATQTTKESVCPEPNDPQEQVNRAESDLANWRYQAWKTGNVPPLVRLPSTAGDPSI